MYECAHHDFYFVKLVCNVFMFIVTSVTSKNYMKIRIFFSLVIVFIDLFSEINKRLSWK